MRIKDQKSKVVYSKNYATQMIVLGHKLLGTMPNPKKPEFICWIFENDDKFTEDLTRLIKGD